MSNKFQFNMHIIYLCPREPWAALGKTLVSNKCFEKCPIYGTFTMLKVLKEIRIAQRITSLDNSIRFITPQDFSSGVFFIASLQSFSFTVEVLR